MATINILTATASFKGQPGYVGKSDGLQWRHDAVIWVSLHFSILIPVLQAFYLILFIHILEHPRLPFIAEWYCRSRLLETARWDMRVFCISGVTLISAYFYADGIFAINRNENENCDVLKLTQAPCVIHLDVEAFFHFKTCSRTFLFLIFSSFNYCIHLLSMLLCLSKLLC